MKIGRNERNEMNKKEYSLYSHKYYLNEKEKNSKNKVTIVSLNKSLLLISNCFQLFPIVLNY